MKNKILILFFFIIIGIGSLYSQKTGFSQIKSASEYDYPPFCIVGEDSIADGFSVDLLKAACEAMNIEVSFKVGEWNVIKQELADGKIDVLPLVGRTPERENLYDFTFPYMTYHGAVFARSGDTRFKNREDLKKAKLLVMKGDNAEEYARRVGLSDSVNTTATFEEAFSLLSEGKCDIVVTQKIMGLNLLKELKIKNVLPVIDLKDYQQSFCFAVKEGNIKLLELLNEGLSIVISNGTFDRIHQKWFSPQFELGKTTLIIGDDNQYPPYAFIDEKGMPAGFNIDLSRAIAKELGILVDIKLDTWSNIRKSLENGEIDAISGMYYSKERDNAYDFTQPHSISSHTIVVRKGSKSYETIDSLRNKKILVEKGDIIYDFLRSEGFDKEIVAVKSQEEALIKLSKGEYDCALVSKILYLFLIDKKKITNLTGSEKSFLPHEYCFAVKNGNNLLLNQLSYALANIKSSGEYRKIYSKWFGKYESYTINYSRIIKYSLAALIPLLMLIFGIMLWNRTLKRQVNKKTKELKEEILVREKTEEALTVSNKAVTESNLAIKESEDKYRQIFESANAGILMSTSEGEILSANHEACRILGRSEDEIIKLGRSKIFDTNDPAFIELLKIRKKTGSFKGDIIGVKKDGSTIPLYLTSNLYLGTDGKERSISIFRDNTERKLFESKQNEYLKELEKNKIASMNLLRDLKKEVEQRRQAEEGLIVLNFELEEKVTERTTKLEEQNKELSNIQDSLVMLLEDVNQTRFELTETNAKLVAANKELEAFSYSVSHDLRSPLRSILGFSDILKNEYEKNLDDEGQRLLKRIVENTTKMQALIDNLLEFSRVGRSNIHLEDIDVKKMLVKIFGDLKDIEKDRKFNLTIDEDIPVVRGDRVLCVQMFENLIGNAIKFTKNKDVSEIKFNYSKDENFDIISIEDNGAGFDEKFKNKLFEVFQRLHSSDEFPGTGVGLSIVQKVVTKHGWSIEAEGKVDEGAKFFIKIPKKIAGTK